MSAALVCCFSLVLWEILLCWLWLPKAWWNYVIHSVTNVLMFDLVLMLVLGLFSQISAEGVHMYIRGHPQHQQCCLSCVCSDTNAASTKCCFIECKGQGFCTMDTSPLDSWHTSWLLHGREDQLPLRLLVLPELHFLSYMSCVTLLFNLLLLH